MSDNKQDNNISNATSTILKIEDILLIVFGFILFLLLLWSLVLGRCSFKSGGRDCGCDEYVVDTVGPKPPVPPNPAKIDTIHENDDLPKPTKNCGVHFSGWYLSDKDEYPWVDCSRIFEDDKYGEYVGQGFYPDNTKILPKSMEHSFDAVAVKKGTRLIIYSEPGFKGREVLNVKGPVLIENVVMRGLYDKLMSYPFADSLGVMFPPERRQWSSENMNDWAKGSCKIICEECEE